MHKTTAQVFPDDINKSRTWLKTSNKSVFRFGFRLLHRKMTVLLYFHLVSHLAETQCDLSCSHPRARKSLWSLFENFRLKQNLSRKNIYTLELSVRANHSSVTHQVCFQALEFTHLPRRTERQRSSGHTAPSCGHSRQCKQVKYSLMWWKSERS